MLVCGLGMALNTTAITLTIKEVSSDGKVTTQQLDEKNILTSPKLLERVVIRLLNAYNLPHLTQIYPLYQQLNKRDPIVELWARAVFLSVNSPKEAVGLYQKLLQIKPNLLPAKLQLAILWIRLRDLSQAKPLLRVLRQSPYPIYRSVAQNYLDFLKPISKWDYDFSLSYVRDNNINNVAPKGSQHKGLISTAEPVAVQGVSYMLNVNRAFHFQPYFMGINFEAKGKYYDKHEYDELDLYFRPSFGVDKDRLQYGIAPFYHLSLYGGGEGAEKGHLSPYYHGVGSDVFLHYYPWKFFKISPHFGYEKRLYRESSDNDKVLRYGLHFAFLQRQFRFDLGVSSKQRITHYAYNDYQQWQFMAGVSGYFSSGFGVNFSAYYTPRQYKKAVAERSFVDFYRIARRDKERQFDFTFWHSRVQFLGVMPRLTLEYKRFRSTNVFQNHVKKQIYLNFTKVY